MKVTSVELHPADSSEVCLLSFRDPRRLEPYNIKSILGLDADEIVFRFSGISDTSKSRYYTLSVGKREIVLNIELNPGFGNSETYSYLRDNLYKMIASSRTGLVQLQFKDGEHVVAAVSGFVKKFEASHFTKNPDVLITINCPDPMLRAPEPVSFTVPYLPMDIPNLKDDISTCPHGFAFEMEFLSNLSDFVIGDPIDSEWSFQVSPSGGFLTGDVLHFSSEYTNKYLFIMRGETQIHVVDAIHPGSVWPMLFPGDNYFGVNDPTALIWLNIYHFPTYWGV
jgi:hypothetical protein